MHEVDGAQNPYRIGNVSRYFKRISEFETSEERFQVASDFVSHFLHSKKQEFFKAAIQPVDLLGPNLQDMQKALEAPIVLGRNLYRIQEAERQLKSDTEDIDRLVVANFYNKNLMRDLVRELGANNPLWQEPLAKLIAMDIEYDELLEKTIDGKVSMKEYNSWLRESYRLIVDSALHLAVGAIAVARS